MYKNRFYQKALKSKSLSRLSRSLSFFGKKGGAGTLVQLSEFLGNGKSRVGWFARTESGGLSRRPLEKTSIDRR